MSEISRGANDPGDQPGGDGGGAPSGTPATPASGGNGQGGGQGGAGNNGGGQGASWRDSLSAEYRDDPSLRGYKTADDIAKAHIHAQRMVGADKVAIPGQKATDEDWANVFKRLGAPDDVEKYAIKGREGASEEDLKVFKTAAKEAGLLPRQAEKMYDYYSKQVDAALETNKANREAAIRRNVDQLKEEWGDSYDKNLNSAWSAMNKVFGKEVAEWADKSGAGNDATFIRMMKTVAGLVSEDKIKGEGGVSFGQSRDQIQDKIDAHYADVNGAYLNPNHPGHHEAQKEVAGLFQMLNKK